MAARRAVILLTLFARVSFSILIILKLPISKPRSGEFIIEMYKHKNESEPKMDNRPETIQFLTALSQNHRPHPAHHHIT